MYFVFTFIFIEEFMVHGGDAHAMSEAQDPSRTTRHKTKKDGLNGTGDTLEAAAPEDRSPNWDNDAGMSIHE